MAGEVSAFISYSHDDMQFVDRLEADLRARAFETWVDRRRLEGTYEWQPQIDRAIEQHGMVIVVVSPSSLTSEYVQHEYQYAHQLDKRIMPILCKPISVPLPTEFGATQYVDFVVRPYETALKELINGWQDPKFDPYVDSRTLYNQAHDLESTDPERAAILYQRLLDREPEYAGGRVRLDLERLNQKLYEQRAHRLREQAEAAHKQGQYGEEAGALQALIALGDHDHVTFSWAEEYLVVAQQNSKWLDTYENVKHFVANGDVDGARDLLAYLWQMENAPFFRDPAGLASTLNLTLPMTYEQWKEERLAGEAKAQREQEAAAERDVLIAHAQASANAAFEEENALWQTAEDIIEKKSDYISDKELRRQLTGWGSASDSLLRSLAWRQRLEVGDSEGCLKATVGLILDVVRLILSVATFAALFVVGGMFGISLVSAVNNAIGKDWFLFVLVVVLVIFLGLLYAAWGAAYGVWIGLGVVSEWGSKRTRTLQQNSMSNQKQRWEALAEAEHRRRLSSIEREQQRLSDEAELQYQAQLPGIDAEHAKTLADIEARYPD